MRFNPEILRGLNFKTAKETLLAENALREYWHTIYPKLKVIITSGNDNSLPKWIEMKRIKGIEGIALHPIFPVVERGVLLEANGGLRYMDQSNGGTNLSHPLRGRDYIMAHTQCLNLYNRVAKGHPSRSKRFPF